jgi:glycosyltransferase involved in cell wall biosynthesis
MWGGVETFLETLALEERASSSMRSVFALCFTGEVADRLCRAGATVRHLPPVRLSRPASVRAGRRELLRLLDEVVPDVVGIHSTWTAAAFGPALARARRPVVSWAHAPDPGPRWQRLLARRCPIDLVIANSQYTRSHRPAGRRGTRVECVYYPVGPRPAAVPRDTTRRLLDAVPDEPVILVAARLEPWKGHAVLIEALGRLPDDVAWRCWIAGGPQRPAEAEFERSLRASCSRLGLDSRVRFLGLRADVADLLAASDLYCQPNVGPEPFGISFVEAMSAGLPVVSTRIGAAVELVDETCGRLSEPGDAGSLAATLAPLLRSAADRRALGEAGRVRATTLCAPAAQIRRIENLLGSLRPVSFSTVAS